jgi:hypothetical protein
MIDTDKYKGHDTGWKAHFFEDGSIAVGGVCTLFTEETGYITRKMIEANALLIQDAPLLLAEVKRLREAIADIARSMDAADPVYLQGFIKDLYEVIE